MAQTTMVVLTCDVHDDGTEAVTTLKIDANGSRSELDVCQDHLDQLVRAAHRPTRKRVPTKKASANGRSKQRTGGDLAATRAWARENGYTVADRGRIPGEIIAAFKASKKKKR